MNPLDSDSTRQRAEAEALKAYPALPGEWMGNGKEQGRLRTAYVKGWLARDSQADAVTEAMVEAAVRTWRDEYEQEFPGSGNWPAMRAALEAAMRARGSE